MNRLPSRGLYAVYLNHELTAVLGYDIPRKEAHLVKLKDVMLPEAEEFVEAVRNGVDPGIPREHTIILESWQLYGLPSGPIKKVTEQFWKKIEEDSALTPQSKRLPE